MSKSLKEMTDAELYAEWRRWDDKISNATGWGAALAAADEFRRAVSREIQLRFAKRVAAGAANVSDG